MSVIKSQFPPSRSQLHDNAGGRMLEASLYPRRFKLLQEHTGANRAAVLLLSGYASITTERKIEELHAPSLFWSPVTTVDSIQLDASSTARLVVLSDDMAKDAIGQNAEALQLRYLVDRPTVVDGFSSAEALEDLQHSFSVILRELKKQERGSWNFLSAHIALILIHCWRLSGCEDLSQQGQGASSTLLLRFRHLVESNFHAHWSVSGYANALGVSGDRLHDLCTRSLERTPLKLIHDRVVREAELLIVRSGLTIEQVADNLGFKSTTHFGQFFRRKTGLTPAVYRKQMQGPAAIAEVTRTYADWP